jgi:hypothetical protein
MNAMVFEEVKLEQVSFGETSVTIPKEIIFENYQLNWEDIEKLTSQASCQQLTKRAKTTPNIVLYHLMNRERKYWLVWTSASFNCYVFLLEIWKC